MKTIPNCCPSAATADLDPTLQASTESETTTSNLHDVSSIHSGLPTLAIWPSLYKEQRKQLTSTMYKGERFILQAPATVEGSICSREADILPRAERYEILVMNRYYRIRSQKEDQLTVATLLYALTHSTRSLSGSYSSLRYKVLPGARSSTRKRSNIAQKTLKELRSQVPR